MYDYDMLVIGSGPSGRTGTIPSETPARNRAQSFGLPGWMPATG
jgi:hypothetical protein